MKTPQYLDEIRFHLSAKNMDKVNDRLWKKLSIYQWTDLIVSFPETFSKCPQSIVRSFGSAGWTWILSKQPSLKDHCDIYDKFMPDEWAFLLVSNGTEFFDIFRQFASENNTLSNDRVWKHIITRFPELVNVCDVGSLSNEDVDDIVAIHPHLDYLRLIMI